MSSNLHSYYDDVYRKDKEHLRTSKLYLLSCVPARGTLKVLDVGCGTGENSASIAAKGHKVYGIDFSSEAIERYCQRGFEGHVMDLERDLDIPDATFDLVFCSEVIEHLACPEILAREVYRVLKPGGALLLSTPNSAFWLYRLLGVLGWTVSELQHPKHLQFFSRRSLRRLLKGAGFTPTEEFGRNMYILLPNLPRTVTGQLSRLGFTREARVRTNGTFWHLSHRARFWNSLFADTLICVMTKLP
jgi:2-polyprenyl-3-methyl-5-hydroxy-6-metoxy-1,4-benzoquinol methylase